MSNDQKCEPSFTRTIWTKRIKKRNHTVVLLKRITKRKPKIEPHFSAASQTAPNEKVTQHSSGCVKLKNSLNDALEEFCSISTIHGVVHIGDKTRPFLDRAWWIFAFALSVFFCSSLIYKTYTKWDETPIIVTFDEKFTSIADIPFPAVTICSGVQINRTIFDFHKVLEELYGVNPPYNISDEEQNYFKAAFHHCTPSFYLHESYELGGDVTDASITELIRKVAPKLRGILWLCVFKDDPFCHEIFQETMTYMGICFTFNMLSGEELYTDEISPDYYRISHSMSGEDWNLESGYAPDLDIELDDTDPQTYPFRMQYTGIENGLSLDLMMEEDSVVLEESCTRRDMNAYTIFLHTPDEVPEPTEKSNYITIRNNSDVELLIIPNVMTSSDGIRNYEPDRRGCFFQSERKLRYIKAYTQRNCELECLSNATLQACGCVKYSMLRAKNTPICGHEKINCYSDLETRFAGRVASKNCNCLPACASITYQAEIRQSSIDSREYAYMHSKVTINFKNNEFTSLKRSEQYGQIDFIANCGGLLGLFIGASFLSIVELLYFFFIRLCRKCRAHMNPKRKNRIADSEVADN